MAADAKRSLDADDRAALIEVLERRFHDHMVRHPDLEWDAVRARLDQATDAMWSLAEMERTGGEPDVVGRDEATGEVLFFDCAPESPKGRRSVCYDGAAREARKKHKPESSAGEMAAAMGVELLDEDQYRALQALGPVDTKTSSWVRTPSAMRDLGGALFGDHRFGRVFFYHNGADSYYAARGFRAVLRV